MRRFWRCERFLTALTSLVCSHLHECNISETCCFPKLEEHSDSARGRSAGGPSERVRRDIHACSSVACRLVSPVARPGESSLRKEPEAASNVS